MRPISERATPKTAEALHVYDFDDTLFDSPLPPDKAEAKGWWIDPGSLMPPVVPEGTEKQRAGAAVPDAHRSAADRKTHAVLVSGRVDVPGMRETVTALLAQMPEVKTVEMWDDLADNLAAVSLAAQTGHVEYRSHLVKTKHYVEHRLPTLDELMEAVERRLSGQIPCEEGHGFPVGTVRKWKDGKDWIKTPSGWEPHSPGHAAPAAMPSTPSTPSTPSGAGGFEPATARRLEEFKPASAARAMSALLATPDSPAAQKAVRDSLRKLCSDFGMLDRDAGSAGANVVKMQSKTQIGAGVNGIHDWTGGIISRDKCVKRAAELMATQAKGEPAPLKGEKGMHVLVHEAIHGHSPIQRKQFKGRYRLLEEATTELASRKVMHDAFGTPWEKFTTQENFGAYGEFCSALHRGVKTALGRLGFEVQPPTGWYDFLGEAAVEMRRRPPPTDPDKGAYLKRFASSLPLPKGQSEKMGGADKVAEEVAGAVWLSLKPAREEEKLRTLKAQMLSPKIPPQMKLAAQQALAAQEDALKKAVADWEGYKAGGPVKEALDRLLDALRPLLAEGVLPEDDDGMLPRNDLDLAVAYARVLDRDGKLTPAAMRDLALLQDDVPGALAALSAAVEQFGLTVTNGQPTTSDAGLVF